MARPESIADNLRRDLLDGIFPPGERLIELQLCDRYGVSRATVRAALVELTSEGLVEREANRGATVRRISIDEAIQITEARAALESLIAAGAANNATDSERAELREIGAKMRQAVKRDESIEYSDLNALLHRRVREISTRTVASHLVDNLRNRASHHQYRLALMPGRPAESLEQHIRIIEAIAEGDAEAASASMQAHLASVIAELGRWAEADAAVRPTSLRRERAGRQSDSSTSPSEST